jgi:multimeric flavodoxin WrbA
MKPNKHGGMTMAKTIVAVNAGPRLNWNTDTLIKEAVKGAEESGAIVKRFDLFRLTKFTGCVSCFGCKKEQFKGHCICKDGLTPVLDAIRQADGLIIGSPNYLGDLTSSFKALYERLVFQNLTYSRDPRCCNENMIPVLLIMTSNAPDTAYLDMLNRYQQTLTGFVGPTKVFVSGDTQQLEDYSKTDWPWYFDAKAKYERHQTVFPKECEKVKELSKEMFG